MRTASLNKSPLLAASKKTSEAAVTFVGFETSFDALITTSCVASEGNSGEIVIEVKSNLDEDEDDEEEDDDDEEEESVFPSPIIFPNPDIAFRTTSWISAPILPSVANVTCSTFPPHASIIAARDDSAA